MSHSATHHSTLPLHCMVGSDVNKDWTLKAKARTKDLIFKVKARTKDLCSVLKESLRPGPRPRTNITDSRSSLVPSVHFFLCLPTCWPKADVLANICWWCVVATAIKTTRYHTKTEIWRTYNISFGVWISRMTVSALSFTFNNTGFSYKNTGK